MASYSGSTINQNYTVRNYFEDEKITPDKQAKILKSIDKTLKKLSSSILDLKNKNSCTDAYKLENYIYCRKSKIKTKTPVLISPTGMYLPLKFRFIKRVLLIFKKKTTESGRYGAEKKIVPIVDLSSATAPLDMQIIGLARVKIDRNNKNKDEKYKIKDLKKELTIFENLQGANTVELLKTFDYTGNNERLRFCMLMEWCPHSLYSKINDTKNPLSIEQKYKHAQSLIEILIKLEQNNIYYRDLKPKNLLLDKNDNLKIADFGLAETLEKSMNSTAGTIGYRAPEFLRGHAIMKQANSDAKKAISKEQKDLAYDDYQKGVSMGATLKGDVWAAGLILYEIFYGRHPFLPNGASKELYVGCTEGDLYENNLRTSHKTVQASLNKIFKDEPAPNNLRGMLKSMLQLDPNNRPTPMELKEMMAEIMQNMGQSATRSDVACSSSVI